MYIMDGSDNVAVAGSARNSSNGRSNTNSNGSGGGSSGGDTAWRFTWRYSRRNALCAAAFASLCAAAFFLLAFLSIGVILGFHSKRDGASSAATSAAALSEQRRWVDVISGGEVSIVDANLGSPKGPAGLRSARAPSAPPSRADSSVPSFLAELPIASPTDRRTLSTDEPSMPPSEYVSDEPSISSNAPSTDQSTTLQKSNAGLPLKLETTEQASQLDTQHSPAESATLTPSSGPAFQSHPSTAIPTEPAVYSKQNELKGSAAISGDASYATYAINVTNWMTAFDALAKSWPTTGDPTEAPSSSPAEIPSDLPAKGPTPPLASYGTLPAVIPAITPTPSLPSANVACLTRAQCDTHRQEMGFRHYIVGEHPMKGCFYKNGVAYFGLGGTVEEMSSPSSGSKIRIWCDGSGLTKSPSYHPAKDPTSELADLSSHGPSKSPSARSTNEPTSTPTKFPSIGPSKSPSGGPTKEPTSAPFGFPSAGPTKSPSAQPMEELTSGPITFPSLTPTRLPSARPTKEQTDRPTDPPSRAPKKFLSAPPTEEPTNEPINFPSLSPAKSPSAQPMMKPTNGPTDNPSGDPTKSPSVRPTKEPTDGPADYPSSNPTKSPSAQPAKEPTNGPTDFPSRSPTKYPSVRPTKGPTDGPTDFPFVSPTEFPSARPTKPTDGPTNFPSHGPTKYPSARPTKEPTNGPTDYPSLSSTKYPSVRPTKEPTDGPTDFPSRNPTKSPSDRPTKEPTNDPTKVPSSHPTKNPSGAPSPLKLTTNMIMPVVIPAIALAPSILLAACLTREECDAGHQRMGIQYYMVGDHLMKGCFYKNEVAYFGLGGTIEEMSSPSQGQKIRIWCDDPSQDHVHSSDTLDLVADDSNDTLDSIAESTPVEPLPVTTPKPTAKPSSTPSHTPTRRPARAPTAKPTRVPTAKPTPMPTTKPTSAPTRKPTRVPTTARPIVSEIADPPPCFTFDTYDRIDDDIERLKNEIADGKDRSHFLGGIVRLAAHDFMDYDRFDRRNPMGPDGCFDPAHPANAGLPEDIWCPDCTLTALYEESYSRLVSRADFWIAAANAVIRQTSVDNELDLADTFVWGRKDVESCPGSGDRLPSPTGCGEVEDVFLRKMGLKWKDAVALLGAHTLGRGGGEFSGHEGTWVDNDADAQVFDKQYYEELYLNSWRPRNADQPNQDWTTGRPSDGGNARMMLNTDVCLVHDIDNGNNDLPCCTSLGTFYPDGQDRCVDAEAARRRCPMYTRSNPRFEAGAAVGEMLGGSYPNDNNGPFYDAFAEAWGKATTAGRAGLMPLTGSCEPLR